MTTGTAATAPAPSAIQPPHRQLASWLALVVPIAAWTIHMVALASLVELSCEHHAVTWVMHGLTVVLGLITIGAMAVAWHEMHLPNGEDNGSAKANIRFLSRVAFAVGAANLALIAAEGVYVALLHPCMGAK